MSEHQNRSGYIREDDDAKLHLAIYLGVVVAGACSIVFLKRAEVGQWTVTSIPISLMLFYLACVSALPRLRLRLDIAGDNLYYLGFTYTLVSLGVALYEFANITDVRIALIQNFGIALSSTIVGIVLRLALNQFRRDPLDIERESRRQLADASRDLRAQLGESAVEFAQFQSNLRQSMMDSHAELREQTGLTLERGFQSFEGIATKAVKSIEQSYGELSKRASEINSLTGTVVTALGTLAARIEAVQLPADIIEQQLRPAITLMRNLAEEIAGTQRNEAEERAKFRQSMADLAEIAASAAETRKRQLEEASDAQSRMREQNTALTLVVAELKGLAASIGAMREKLMESATSTAESRKRQLDEETHAQSRMHEQSKALTTVVAELNGLAAAIGQMRGRLVSEIERGHADLSTHTGHLARVASELSSASKASLEAARALEAAGRTHTAWLHSSRASTPPAPATAPHDMRGDRSFDPSAASATWSSPPIDPEPPPSQIAKEANFRGAPPVSADTGTAIRDAPPSPLQRSGNASVAEPSKPVPSRSRIASFIFGSKKGGS